VFTNRQVSGQILAIREHTRGRSGDSRTRRVRATVAGEGVVPFALLGFLTWYGLPGIAPGATGARHASVLGSITPGHTPLRLPDPATSTPQRLDLLPS